MSAETACAVCDAGALEFIAGFSTLPRVTSDTKPWPAGGKLAVCSLCGAIQKPADNTWLEETGRIYRDYEAYFLSKGKDQAVFGEYGEAEPRSLRVVERLVRKIDAGISGRLLDIGCGSGAALDSFARVLPGWELNGADLTERALPILSSIKGFARLYTCPIEQIEDRFGIVSMFHALEHMVAPLTTLKSASALLETKGSLIVEVPDVETSPFDLLVADHRMHFSRASMTYLIARAGLAPSLVANDLVPKEISVAARPGEMMPAKPDPRRGMEIARATIAWLHEVVVAAARLAEAGRIGIFGTAVAGMALYGALRERVGFFIDEDPNRIGRSFEGRPILAPADAPKGTPIFVALAPEVADKVVGRLGTTGVRLVVPPAFRPHSSSAA